MDFQLVVLVPPSIWAVLPGGAGQPNRPIEAREGSSIQLECQAEGIPPPVIRWRRPVSFILTFKSLKNIMTFFTLHIHLIESVQSSFPVAWKPLKIVSRRDNENSRRSCEVILMKVFNMIHCSNVFTIIIKGYDVTF